MHPGHVDAVVAARPLFDHDVRPEWTQRFLDDPNHHLCIAYVNGEPAGFVSGVETTHPDKGTEMFLYELSVGEPFRRQGVGRALVEALATLARQRGSYGMWVLTEADNDAALATYRAAGAVDESNEVMLGWRLDPGHETFTTGPDAAS
jgi:ribosomal protein S18 acetylase RimI-like enzyme